MLHAPSSSLGLLHKRSGALLCLLRRVFLDKLLVNILLLFVLLVLLPVFLLLVLVTVELGSHVGVVVERSSLPILELRVHLEGGVEVHGLRSHILVWVESADGYDVGQRRNREHWLDW